MLIENYPVGWAVGVGKPEPVLVYLIDLPGIAMQGRTLKDALGKLQAVAPSVLATYRREGRALPQPSREPNLLIGGVQWLRAARLSQAKTSPSELELGADIQLAPA